MSTHAGETRRTRASTTARVKNNEGGGESTMPRAWSSADRQQAGLRPEATPSSNGALTVTQEAQNDRIRYDPHAAVDPARLIYLYGEHQLGAALSVYGLAKLQPALHAMRERFPGTGPKDARSKNSVVRYLTRMATQGRYSADFLPEATGARAKNGEGARTKATTARTTRPGQSSASRAAQTTGFTGTPIRTLSDAENRVWQQVTANHYNPFATLNPYYTARVYGNEQLRAALGDYSVAKLRAAAAMMQRRLASQGITVPPIRGRTSHDLADKIARVVEQYPQAPFYANDYQS